MTGAQALIKSLEMQGTDVMFGLPGGAILPVYDPIIDSSIRHILVRHEQGAGHMAEGYAMATGRPGVAIVTSGPGATNIVTPLANAYMDSTPLIVVSGQVATGSIGTDAFQECDITGVTMGITKHNWLIKDVNDIPRVVAAAFHVATTGRPGPVLIDLPKDISNATMEWYWPTSVDDLDLPGYHPVTFGDPVLIGQAAELISQAHRPVFYVGGGVLKARAAEALRVLAERTGIPVVTTLMARGAFPDSHPQALGMPGMHGHYTAVTALQKSDLLISLGARFDDRVTGKISAFAPDAKVIHVDIDPAELGKVRIPDVGIAGDCRQVIEEMLLAMDAQADRPAGAGSGTRGGSRSTSGVSASRCITRTSKAGRSSRRTSSSSCATRRRRTPSSSPAWASTKCGPRSTGSSSTPTPGSTPAAPAPWASPCRPPSGPRWADRTARCGPSTATAASK